MTRSDSAAWMSRAEWLLTEAFSGMTAAADFEDIAKASAAKEWNAFDHYGPSAPPPVDPPRDWFEALILHAGELLYAVAPQPGPHGSGPADSAGPSNHEHASQNPDQTRAEATTPPWLTPSGSNAARAARPTVRTTTIAMAMKINPSVIAAPVT